MEVHVEGSHILPTEPKQLPKQKCGHLTRSHEKAITREALKRRVRPTTKFEAEQPVVKNVQQEKTKNQRVKRHIGRCNIEQWEKLKNQLKCRTDQEFAKALLNIADYSLR